MPPATLQGFTLTLSGYGEETPQELLQKSIRQYKTPHCRRYRLKTSKTNMEPYSEWGKLAKAALEKSVSLQSTGSVRNLHSKNKQRQRSSKGFGGLKLLNAPNQMSIKYFSPITPVCLRLCTQGCPLHYLETSFLQANTCISLKAKHQVAF